MKRVSLLLISALVAGCATTTGGTRDDLARYGTAPSEEDLYQMMSHYRDQLPPTRYVSYRDKGYQNSVKKVEYSDAQGKLQAGWEYDFEVSNYDSVDQPPPEWTPRRAIFFNGRLIRLTDQAGNVIPLNSQTQATVPAVPAQPPNTVSPRR